MATTLGKANALRYRSYIYDTETSLYYLQSRYYNPGTGRFINADALVATGQGLLGNNMFAYCQNNAVNLVDSSGQFCELLDPMAQMIKNWGDLRAEIVEENYENNSSMDSNPETSTKDKIINDQNGTTGKNFRYGNYAASHNGCEAIAIHNAMVLLGMSSSLSAVMKACQDLYIMIGDGYFGSNPVAIGRVLRHYGVEYSRVGLSQMTQKGVYIISYWVRGSAINGLHTVAVYYDGTKYTTYNRGSGQSDESPFIYANSYICGYYLGG